MKRYFIGIAAVVLAFSAVAFTSPKPHTAYDVYYFPLDANAAPVSYERDVATPYTAYHLGCNSSSNPCEGAVATYDITGSGPYTFTPTSDLISGTRRNKP